MLTCADWKEGCRAAPALAAVVATPHDIPLLHTQGSLSTETHRPVGRDTPFYIASQTKSYLGLLAALLHYKEILPLHVTLDEVWPQLKLPNRLDARDVSLLHLLTHQLPLTSDKLCQRTSYEDEVLAAEYPTLLASFQPRKPGFQYDNLGYLVYAASLETVTGISWKEWLQHNIFGPLCMTQTSSRTSDFPICELPWRQLREDGHWRSYPPKPDALMHAAGGLYSSPVDLAKWMQANLSCKANGFPQEVFRCAHDPIVRAESIDGPFRWTHYGLGLQLGSINGVDVLGHRGGYAGARSLTVIAPGAEVGLALAVTADFETREVLDRIVSAFFWGLSGTIQVGL